MTIPALDQPLARKASPGVPAETAGPVPTAVPGHPAGVPAAPVAGGLDPTTRRRMALLRFAVSISVLTILGQAVLGFEQPIYVPVLSVLVSYAAALLFETVDAWSHHRVAEFRGGDRNLFYFLLPPHIAALACSMLLYADNTAPYLFAVIAAAGSKYVFRLRINGRLRHYLNPSNFGIALTLLLMPTVGFAPPYMFLTNIDSPWDWLLPAGILMLGTMLNGKLTAKMPLIAAWVGGFVLQAVLRHLIFGDDLTVILAVMTGVPFILYTNYMMTDPGTSPARPRGQVIFGLTLALSYGALIVLQVSYAIFFALIITCFLRGAVLLITRTRTNRAAARLAVNHG